jgi:hypothetical protein
LDRTALVAAGFAGGLELVHALDRSSLSISVALWLHSPEYEDWRFVLASRRLDAARRAEAYGLVHDAPGNPKYLASRFNHFRISGPDPPLSPCYTGSRSCPTPKPIANPETHSAQNSPKVRLPLLATHGFHDTCTPQKKLRRIPPGASPQRRHSPGPASRHSACLLRDSNPGQFSIELNRFAVIVYVAAYRWRLARDSSTLDSVIAK